MQFLEVTEQNKEKYQSFVRANGRFFARLAMGVILNKLSARKYIIL